MKFEVIDKFVGEYYFLSNMFPCKIEYNGLVFDCAEAAFQAQKKPDMAHLFVGVDGYTARKIGNDISMSAEDLKRWDPETKKLEMLWVLQRKFEQNPDLLEKLNATGDAILIDEDYCGEAYWLANHGKDEVNLGIILALIRKATLVTKVMARYKTRYEEYVKREEFSGLEAIWQLDYINYEYKYPAYTIVNGHVYRNKACIEYCNQHKAQ